MASSSLLDPIGGPGRSGPAPLTCAASRAPRPTSGQGPGLRPRRRELLQTIQNYLSQTFTLLAGYFFGMRCILFKEGSSIKPETVHNPSKTVLDRILGQRAR
jgi:hypothetical protein